MLPSRPDKTQLVWEALKQGLCFLKQTEKSDFFFFFEVARSRSGTIWTEPEWVVQRRALGLA